MPDTLRPTSVTSAFTELLCADESWLRAEFDEIVAANFDVPPTLPPRPRSPSSGPRRTGFPPRPGGDAVGGMPSRRPRYRQRSPPLTGACPVTP